MFSFYIAKRYLKTKKSHHAINIISGVAVCGVAIATAALVCILSVFNGFQDMIADLFTAFDPELKVVPKEGKFMDADCKELNELRDNANIAVYSEVLQDNALMMVNNRQVMATIKGVDDNFEQLIDFDRIKFGDGVYELHADVIEYGILGVNLLAMLGVGADFPTPIQVYAPRGDEHIDMNDPSESFNQDELYSPHVGFTVKQQKYDSNLAITSLRFARNIFEREGKVSSIELKLKDSGKVDKVKKEISKSLGEKYVVLDRYEQQEDTFKIMKIEKLISYIFLTFILMIACFNIIGSLSMLIIDKKQDAVTLRNLGATDKQISNIFLIEGRLISLVGAVIGIALGLLLCGLQQYFGIIKFGHSAGSYIIDAYPVSVHFTDIVIIFITVIIVGFISVWYPVRHLSKKYTAMLSFVLVVFLTSCSNDGGQFSIKGEIEDMPVGQLYIYNLEGSDARIDTIMINDGEFKYTGVVDETTPFMLVYPNALEQVIFAGSGDEIHYKAAANDLKNYSVDGNDENQLMNEFRRKTEGMNAVQMQEVARQFIRENADGLVAIYLLERYFVQDESVEMSDLGDMLQLVKKAQPDNLFVMEIENKMKQMAGGLIGATLPDIEIENQKGKKINVGKVGSEYLTLLFWSSWMVNQYDFIDDLSVLEEDYRDNGRMKIVAVSLDTEVYKWQEFIKEDSLYCDHSCDANGWDSPIVKKLGVTSLPTYFIADKSHKIIAKGKSVDELRSDFERLLDE